MKSIEEIDFLQNVRVLVRADFNVPIHNGVIANDFRIRSAIPTINFLKEKGARIILISHIESNDGSDVSLAPVAKRLGELGVPTKFIKNIRNAFSEIENSTSENCFLIENLRVHKGEKSNDAEFSKELASLGDVYVNNAFSVSHREHASVVSVPRLLPSYAGFQLINEVENLSKAFSPSHPFVFILGGAKFHTKIPLLKKFINSADTIFMGGALANDLLRAKGINVGDSLVSDGDLAQVQEFTNNKKLLLPVDVMDQNHKVRSVETLADSDKIMDVGPATMAQLSAKIVGAEFILWNGPMGLCEDGFQDATLEVARMIARATSERGAESIVGGGDTLSAIESLGMGDKFGFVSTAGGAMLQFLADGTLPGIEAISR